jgi:hypothetical protein
MLVKFGSLCSDSLEESSLFLQWTVRLWKWWLACRKGIGKYDRKGFDTFGLLIAWSLLVSLAWRVFFSPLCWFAFCLGSALGLAKAL